MNADKIIVFLATWSLVSLLVLVLSAILRSQVVFGNEDISGYLSAVVWSFLFTFVGQLSPRILSQIDLKLKDERYAMVVTAIALTPVIWLIKRFAIFTGLGISNNFFVLVLAIIAAVSTFYGSKYSSFYLKKLQ